MTKKFVLEIELIPGQHPKIGIDGDISSDTWQADIVTGIIEILSMLEQMYGLEATDPIYKRTRGN
jgi:hypothetical protein